MIEVNLPTSLTTQPKAEILQPNLTALEEKRLVLRNDYLQIIKYASTLIIDDDESYKIAIDAGRTLQIAQKQVEELYRPIKQTFDANKKIILEMEHQDVSEIKTVKDRLAGDSLKYEKQQEELRRQAEEAARLAILKAEEERRLAEAIHLEAEGRSEEAAARLDEPILTAPVIVQTGMTQKPRGSVRREIWRARVENFSMLVKAVAEGKVSLLALTANQSWLDKEAANYQQGFNIPGVSSYSEVKAHFRS